MAATDPFDEIDYEADDEDVTQSERTPVTVSTGDRVPGTPSLIVDDLHVRYKVFGGKKRAVSGAAPMSRARRLLNRSASQVGAAVSEVHAVKGVSFVAHHGESIGVVGRNGAGKSTLLRAVAGLIPPSQGTVYVSGTSSLLGVNAALMSSLSGERNIVLGGLALGLTPEQIKSRFDEIVEFSGIGDFVYLPMNAYSSGMASRLRFAISTAAVPDILMIDEALATGDAEFRSKSKQKIEEIRDHAGTVFLVSHSSVTVERMCTRALWLEKGELIMDGPSKDVTRAYRASLKSG